MVNVMSDASLFEMKTKHSWPSSIEVVELVVVESSLELSDVVVPLDGVVAAPVFAIKLKYFFTPFSSAQ
jgi:hypothetical protein